MRKIRFCYDVVCPYSYMESHLIETARTQVRSMSNGFRSSCGRPRRRCSRSGATTARRLDEACPQARARPPDRDPRPRYQPRSTLPLATCLWAGDQGRLREFKHPLYEALFCEGEDTSRTARSRVPPTEPGSIRPLPSPRRTRPSRAPESGRSDSKPKRQACAECRPSWPRMAPRTGAWAASSDCSKGGRSCRERVSP
jgi:hypothetical protein